MEFISFEEAYKKFFYNHWEKENGANVLTAYTTHLAEKDFLFRPLSKEDLLTVSLKRTAWSFLSILASDKIHKQKANHTVYPMEPPVSCPFQTIERRYEEIIKRNGYYIDEDGITFHVLIEDSPYLLVEYKKLSLLLDCYPYIHAEIRNLILINEYIHENNSSFSNKKEFLAILEKVFENNPITLRSRKLERYWHILKPGDYDDD